MTEPKRYVADHGWTPGKFTPQKCRVQLARYSCPWPQKEHNPELPPADIDAFGYKRKKKH